MAQQTFIAVLTIEADEQHKLPDAHDLATALACMLDAPDTGADDPWRSADEGVTVYTGLPDLQQDVRDGVLVLPTAIVPTA